MGVREAKANLSRLLADARSGREWVITERGTPIARIVPMASEGRSTEERLRDLEAAGIVGPARPRTRALAPPAPVEFGIGQRFLQEDRDG
jgi:prevent-host-death family protein